MNDWEKFELGLTLKKKLAQKGENGDDTKCSVLHPISMHVILPNAGIVLS